MSLKKYNEMRDFEKTSEPRGRKKSSEAERIFAVQKHAASRLHYDFRLEWDGVLLSWAVPKGPSYNPADKRLAVEVEPHPYDYKDFEGTIPKGEYGGGTVMLWDEGTWEPQEGEDFAKGLKEGSLKFVLHGTRLHGRWTLVRMKPKAGEEDRNWLLIKEKDDFTQTSPGISRYTTGVRSGKTMDEISGQETEDAFSFPPMQKVQLASLRAEIPEGDHWIHELKYDGYRIVAENFSGHVRLYSRNGKDYTEQFPAIRDELQSWKTDAVLDGEVVLQAGGKSSFQALQQYLKHKKGQPAYMAFDLLYDGEDLRPLPLQERRDRLEKLLKESTAEHIQFSRAFRGDSGDLLRQVCGAGMEGIISKRLDRPYTSGRTSDWLKIKCRQSSCLTILGFTQSGKRTRALSSLLLGKEEEGGLRYAGRVGTGFTDETAKELHAKLKPLIRKTAPIQDPPKARSGETISWVTPKLCAQVQFAEWTNDGLVRQASFLGVQTEASKKKKEKPNAPEKGKETGNRKKEPETVQLSSPEKRMFADYTKEDLADYYAIVAERMLPFLENRLLSLVRCPDGIGKDCFYQKHLKEELPGLYAEEITESDGDKADYIYLKNAQGLRQAVQNGTIEFHGWGSRIEHLEQPDLIVFDLDPDEGLGLKEVRRGVRDLKSILDDLGLEAFLKTSGGKGYHIVIPLEPQAGWEEIRGFSKNIAELMEQRWPDRYTSIMRKEQRKGKIYVDWVRNGRGATSVAPYSVRARKGAPVSWPIRWEELSRVAPSEYTMEKALKSRKKNPWEGFFTVRQKLKQGQTS